MATEGTKFQVNFKLADGTLVNIYAATSVELETGLATIQDSSALINSVSASLASAGAVRALAQGLGATPAYAAPAAPAYAPPAAPAACAGASSSGAAAAAAAAALRLGALRVQPVITCLPHPHTHWAHPACVAGSCAPPLAPCAALRLTLQPAACAGAACAG